MIFLFKATGGRLTDGAKLWLGPEKLEKRDLWTGSLNNIAHPALAQPALPATQTVCHNTNNVHFRLMAYEPYVLQKCALLRPPRNKQAAKCPKRTVTVGLEALELALMPTNVPYIQSLRTNFAYRTVLQRQLCKQPSATSTQKLAKA